MVFAAAQTTRPRVLRGLALRIWSGKRDSNSRPRPWQGRALPTELFPRKNAHYGDAANLVNPRAHSCPKSNGRFDATSPRTDGHAARRYCRPDQMVRIAATASSDSPT